MSKTGKLFGIDSSRQAPLTPEDFDELTVFEPETRPIGDIGRAVIEQMWYQNDEAESYADAA